MRWDLGIQGLSVLTLMSLGFGAIARFLAGRSGSRWLWVVGAATYFVSGLFISEVLFGWATGADLQPNIDGLSFDEVLLVGLIPSVAVVLLTWYVARSGQHRTHSR